MKFILDQNHFYDSVREHLDESLRYGQKIYELSRVILLEGETKAHDLTKNALMQWSKDLQKQKQKSWKTKPYEGSPDRILYNRYHLLQIRVFHKLKELEIEEEDFWSEVVKIHPWILTLRYAKAILTLTAHKSEHRTVGICRILRDYSFSEIVDVFEKSWPSDAAGRILDEQYFRNVSTKLFGSPFQPLRNRFEKFGTISERGNSIQPFDEVAEHDPVVSWIAGYLNGLLAPWGVAPVLVDRTDSSNLDDNQVLIYALSSVGAERIKRP